MVEESLPEKQTRRLRSEGREGGSHPGQGRMSKRGRVFVARRERTLRREEPGPKSGPGGLSPGEEVVIREGCKQGGTRTDSIFQACPMTPI